jgi:aspartyl-tRNA synthetase
MRVQLSGWLAHKRQIGKHLIFCALRDETGTVQIKFTNVKLKDELLNLNIESVISVSGTVVKRPSDDVSLQKMGDLEVEADALKILNHACDLPFSLKEASLNEETRLKFRHVDLRRQSMVENIRKRQEIVVLIRTSLEDFGFREFETPLLFKSTPEGASEFLGMIQST